MKHFFDQTSKLEPSVQLELIKEARSELKKRPMNVAGDED